MRVVPQSSRLLKLPCRWAGRDGEARVEIWEKYSEPVPLHEEDRQRHLVYLGQRFPDRTFANSFGEHPTEP